MAAASTKRYAEGKPLSFMDGIPVAVKESYDVVSFSISVVFLFVFICTQICTVVR